MDSMKQLPISTADFRTIRENGLVYVDKTRFLYRLASARGSFFFLSRPRRFGKSLTISTLEELFRGSRELFDGLWIAGSDYAWEEYPVIRLDFGSGRMWSAEDVEEFVVQKLKDAGAAWEVQLEKADYAGVTEELIAKIARKQGTQVVVLIDEYDRPILDNIEDRKRAAAIREVLKGFYSTLKSCDRYLRFLFVTGVSKFSKTGVFSGLNNLEDITMDDEYADFLGYTQQEVETCFAAHIQDAAARLGLNREGLLQELRRWYNGYRFSKRDVSVYNPFTTMLFLKKADFRNYWFESGTPTFLTKLIREQGFDVRGIERLYVSDAVFATYDIENLNILAILFQTGYLTIADYDKKKERYRLYYPNVEVEKSFVEVLAAEMANTVPGTNEAVVWDLIDDLRAEDLEAFFEHLRFFFANIPYDLFLPREAYFQTVFYLVFKLMGLRTRAECKTSQGQVDVAVELGNLVYVFEFKFGRSADEALEQIRRQRYYERFKRPGVKVWLVGADFRMERRAVREYRAEVV